MSRRKRRSWAEEGESVLLDGLEVLRARIEDARRPDSEVTLGELVRALEGLAEKLTVRAAILPSGDEELPRPRRRSRNRLEGDP